MYTKLRNSYRETDGSELAKILRQIASEFPLFRSAIREAAYRIDPIMQIRDWQPPMEKL